MSGDATTRRRSPTRAVRRSVKWVLSVVLFASVAVALTGAMLVWTGRGQEIMLARGLSWANDRLAGRLSVEEVRTGSLLRGAVLVGVRLEVDGGEPVVRADSLAVRYSLFGLLTGQRRLAAVSVWGLHLRIAPLEDGALNVTRVLKPSEAEAGEPEPLLRVGRLSVHESLLEVLPAPSAEEDGGNGRRGGRVALDSLDLELEDLLLQSGAETVTAVLADLSTRLELLEEPLRLSEGRARLSFGRAGLRLMDASFRLGGSPLSGTLALGPDEPGGPWRLTLDARADRPARLADFRWIDPRVPAGTARGGVRLRTGERLDLELSRLAVELDDTRLMLDGGVTFVEGEPRLRALEVEASPLALEDVRPWIERDLPWGGWLSGRAVFTGGSDSLRAEGRVTLVPSGVQAAATTAEFSGTLLLGEARGVRDLSAHIEPLDYALVTDLVPRLALAGIGSATVEATGDTRRGFDFRVDLTRAEAAPVRSRLRAEGSALRRGQRWWLDVAGQVDSVALEVVAGLVPEAGLTGRVTGRVEARGPVDSLHVTGALLAESGTLDFELDVDALDPAAGYRLSATAVDLPLSGLVSRAPEKTVWTGSLSAEGRGLSLDSLVGDGSFSAVGSSFRGIGVDSMLARVRVVDRVMEIDTLAVGMSGMRAAGSGRLGMVAGMERTARFYVDVDSVARLRPLVLGENLVARESLTDLEQQLLILEGADPDTFPTLEEISMSGELHGIVELRGSLDSLDVGATVRVLSASVGLNGLDSLYATGSVRGLPSPDAAFDFTAFAAGIVLGERSFEAVQVDARGRGRQGVGNLDVTARPGERLTASGAFELEEGRAGRVRLERAAADLDSLVLELARPGEVEWDSTSVRVADLELVRAGEDPMSVVASGTLARFGESDFHLEIQGLHMERVARITQIPEFPAEGHVDLSLAVAGPPSDLSVELLFQIQEPRYRSLSLARVGGTLEYRDNAATMRLDAFSPDRLVFTADGALPLELTLDALPRWRAGAPVDMRVVTDSLDAAVALAYVTALEDVAGTISGEFTLRGTVEELEPEGVIRLTGGAWTIEALGTRQSGVSGSLSLRRDRAVEVRLSTSQPGFSEVTGTVTLEPLSDPVLDLDLQFREFVAVSRRDVDATISGQLALTGRYRRPVIDGALTVNRSTIYVDEFVRTARVVDLNDPLFEDLFESATFDTPSLVGDLQNPFLGNLRLSVELSVPQEAWLRSGTAAGARPLEEEMNVEMGGDLLVVYDRREGDLVLVGSLEALRGSYRLLGRTFELEEGTVTFPGTAGIDPALDLSAVTRVRAQTGGRTENLAITATVEGTLTQPRVSLSSEAQGVPESELISYLVFGRPTSQLATGSGTLRGGQGAGALGSALGLTGTFLTSALLNTLSSEVLAPLLPFGVDYLSVSQVGTGGLFEEEQAFLASTLLEMGTYVGRDVFVVVTFRRRDDEVDGSLPIGGVRAEWAMYPNWTLEAFHEDRLLRSRVFIAEDLAGRATGFFIFREWGY